MTYVLALAQLVSQGQVDAARNKALMWTAFAVIMGILAVVQIIRAVNKSKKNRDQNAAQGG